MDPVKGGRMSLKLAAIAAIALAGAAGLVSPLFLDAPVATATSNLAASIAGAEADSARVRLAITGMTCGSCATTARIALERSEGVYRAKVSYDSATAVVDYDPDKTSPSLFIAALKKLTGYGAAVVVEPSKG
jgi:copper chaperone CopZ